jgi:undecaprenyl-diphosphatase
VSFLHAIFLGIVQGLTEFLPISSTAHLTLAGKMFGFVDESNPAAWTEFIAVMQLGTLAAVLVYFWRDLLGMGRALASDIRSKGLSVRSWSLQSWLALYIVLGTLPVAVIGYGLKQVIEGMLTKTTVVIVGGLVGLAALLWFAEKISTRARSLEQLDWKDAILIGFAQALALIPGSSRSGTTITASLLLGFNRTAAARFSFLLSIPAVLASGIFEMARIDQAVFTLGTGNLAIATLFAGVSGYAAIAWLLRFLMKHSMMAFVWYRFALGILLTILLLNGVMMP